MVDECCSTFSRALFSGVVELQLVVVGLAVDHGDSGSVRAPQEEPCNGKMGFRSASLEESIVSESGGISGDDALIRGVQ